MGLPRTRDYTAVDGTTGFPAATDQALQDMAIRSHFLTRDSDLFFYDDFVGTSVDLSKWIAGGTVSTFTVASDTGAKGVLAFSDAAGVVGHYETTTLNLGTSDFEFVASVKLISVAGGAGSQFLFGLLGGAAVLDWLVPVGGTNWTVAINGVVQVNSTNVAINASAYQQLRIERKAGVTSCYVDGTLIFSTNATLDFTGSKLCYEPRRQTSGTTAAKLDYVKLWAPRT